MNSDGVRTFEGRKVFALFYVFILAIGAFMGVIIGTSREIHHIALAGVTLFHPTPPSMALYGVIGTGLATGGIYAIIALLSRFDDAKV